MNDDYEITRAAIEVQRKPAPSPKDIELAAIERQQKRFFWLSIATMVVSFIHMVGALALFSDGSGIGKFAALMMTGLVDAATWVVTGYYDYAKRRNKKRGRLVAGLLIVALVISCGLNLAYMIQHMPSSLPGLVGWSIALAFAVFIPLCIAVAASERGQLEDDKTVYLASEQAALAAPENANAGQTPIITNMDFVPSERHNEQLLPPAATMPRVGNGKAGVSTGDVPAIIRTLYGKRVHRFSSVAELAAIVGWAAPSSGSAALANLQKAGVVGQKTDVGYKIDWRTAQQLMVENAANVE